MSFPRPWVSGCTWRRAVLPRSSSRSVHPGLTQSPCSSCPAKSAECASGFLISLAALGSAVAKERISMTTSSGTASSASQPGSHSGSRHGDFPPRPKSVRVWPVVPAALPDSSLPPAQEQPQEQPEKAVSGRLWAGIFTLGLAALMALGLALWLAKNLKSYLVN